MPGSPVARIWRFTDGRPGHENQSAALVEALEQAGRFECRTVPVDATPWNELLASRPDAGKPDLVVGAGHRTHGALLAASRRFDCPSVLLMKPTLPTAFFDLCLIPRHDLPGDRNLPENVVLTHGMLSRVPREVPPKGPTGLILVGGPSKHHGWDADLLGAAIPRITSGGTKLTWHLTDSRRTPDGFIANLRGDGFTFHPYQETPPDWLPAQLATAREAWVTEDSMSMIYEALTAGCGVGLLPVPVRNPRSRVVHGVRQLATDRWVTNFADWDGGPLPGPPAPLHEATRCAREVLQRFFPALA